MRQFSIVFLLALLGCNVSHRVDSTPPATTVAAVDASTEAKAYDGPFQGAVPGVEVPPPPVLVPVSRHVLIIGDSEACAVGWVVKGTVKKINEEAQQPYDRVDVVCKGGTMVQYWGRQGNFRAALSKHPNPDTVLVFLGTNHYHQQTTPEVGPILDVVKEYGFNCVWVGNTAVKGGRYKINKLLREAVQPTCSYFDTEAAGIPLADGIHPNGAGAAKWIRAIWPMIPVKYEERHE